MIHLFLILLMGYCLIILILNVFVEFMMCSLAWALMGWADRLFVSCRFRWRKLLLLFLFVVCVIRFGWISILLRVVLCRANFSLVSMLLRSPLCRSCRFLSVHMPILLHCNLRNRQVLNLLRISRTPLPDKPFS